MSHLKVDQASLPDPAALLLRDLLNCLKYRLYYGDQVGDILAFLVGSLHLEALGVYDSPELRDLKGQIFDLLKNEAVSWQVR
jgi:hypothetical protein